MGAMGAIRQGGHRREGDRLPGRRHRTTPRSSSSVRPAAGRSSPSSAAHPCNQPTSPIDIVEEAVARYYGDVLVLDPEWLHEVREAVDAAVAADRGLSVELRDQYDKRLAVLDRKERYWLDLAAEENWPKDKLRECIDAVCQEAADLRNVIQRADQRLKVGQQVLHEALALLDAPQAAYVSGNELVKTALNRAFSPRSMSMLRRSPGTS